MIIQQMWTQAFTPGRSCPGPVKVVLHGQQGILSQVDQKMREDCDALLSTPKEHESFHFGLDGSTIHQYVSVSDTAWSFDNSVTTVGARNCDTINIVLTYGVTRLGGCPPGSPYQEEDYRSLAKLLCSLGYTTVTGNLSIHNNELPGFDLGRLQTELSSLGTCPPPAAIEPICLELSQIDSRLPGTNPEFIFVDDQGCGRTAPGNFGGGTTVVLNWNPPNLSVTVNGITSNSIPTTLAKDTFGVPLGYLLPL